MLPSAPTARMMWRSRFPGAVIATATVVLLVMLGAERWRVLVVVGVLAFIAVAFVTPDRLRSNAGAVYLVPALMFGGQTALIVVTGGLDSPLLLTLLPTALLAGVAIRRSAVVALYSAYPAALIVALAMFKFWMADALLFPSLAPGTLVHSSIFLGVLSGAVVAGAVMTSSVRSGLDAATAEVVRSHRAQARDAQERNRDLFGLTAGLAHEIKNPLSAIYGLATLVQRRSQAKQREHMDVMVEEIVRLRRTIDAFLDFSRPVGPMTLSDVDLRALADDVALVYTGVADDISITVHGVATLTCDARKIRQVISNLVQNALDAAREAVRLELEPSHDGVHIRVVDDGVGIDPEMLLRLFEPGATTKPSGSGLGLVVCRALAEQHGGSLVLRDSPTGCSAVLWLPGAKP